MTSISNLLIHDTTTTTTTTLYQPQQQQQQSSYSLPPIHGDDPPRKLTYYYNQHPPPNQRKRSISSQTPFSPPPRKKSTSVVVSEEEEDQITFLTPTVWHIPTSQEQKQRELNAKHITLENDDYSSMTAFTSSNMDTVLYMPRKKRGRKPKTFLHGNSCFIWKDLTSTRSK